MEKVELRNAKGFTCQVYRHGAHITSWKTPEGKELLFVSKQAIFAPPKAIRGGVPVCFPQFGMMGPMSTQHGFARNTEFSIESKAEDSVTMVLNYDGRSQPAYPHPFTLKIAVTIVEDRLLQDVTVTNTGTADMKITMALHTYFKVQDISKVHVTGLSGIDYLDNLRQYERVKDTAVRLVFEQEVDRVYVGVPQDIEIHDGSSGSVMTLQRTNLPDAVVWNPWIDKAKGMADFGDEEYKEMLCIEPALAGTGPATVAPGATWSANQTLLLYKA